MSIFLFTNAIAAAIGEAFTRKFRLHLVPIQILYSNGFVSAIY
jgi:hypothetical protein